jgi:polyisoprenoid-binding protein YceI
MQRRAALPSLAYPCALDAQAQSSIASGMQKIMLTWTLLAFSTVALAAPVKFELDPVHTQIFFSVEHAGFSHSTGKLLNPTGSLTIDTDNWSASEVQVRMLASRINFDDPAWNKAMQGKSYFNAQLFPELTFRSTSLTLENCAMRAATSTDQLKLPTCAPGAENTPIKGELVGDLTLLGITRSVTLQIQFNKRGRHPYTLKDTVGFDASGTLKRSDFGMSATPKTLGDVVTLRIAVEATRVRENKAQGKR